ncbi:MAG: cytochrome P450 [Chloroflexi bacterium]|nr:cytochrome P450 [Chloroflexota bacterium]
MNVVQAPPVGVPVLGILPDVLLGQTLQTFNDAQRRSNGLFRLMIGPQEIYVVTDPDYAQHVLQSNARNYVKGWAYKALRDWSLGNGLLTSDGDFWLKQRRLMQPHFHQNQLAYLNDTMVAVIDDMCAEWEEVARTGETIDIGQEMGRLTMQIMTQTVFGNDILTKAEAEGVMEAVSVLARGVMLRLFLGFVPPWLSLPGDAQLRRMREVIAQTVRKVIREEERRGESNTVIGMLMSATYDESDERMSEQQLLDEAITLFLAGFETTSNALTFTFYYLHHHPGVRLKVLAELQAQLGDRSPTVADLRNLTYTRMVLNEAMRIAPPAAAVPRAVVAADEIDGYQIPANALLWVYIYGLHHHPAHWDKPDVFDPERFSPEASEGRHRFAYIPFLSGARQCIGKDFALMEAMLALSIVLRRYDLALEPDQEIKPQLHVTTQPSGPVSARIRRLR